MVTYFFCCNTNLNTVTSLFQIGWRVWRILSISADFAIFDAACERYNHLVILRFSFGLPSVIFGDRTKKSPATAGRSLLCCYSSYQWLSNQLLINTCKATEFLNRNELELVFLKCDAHSLNQSLCSADFTADNVHDIPGINNNSLRYVLFQKHEPDLYSLYKINTTAMGNHRRQKI